MKKTNLILTAVMVGAAFLLMIGNLMIVNALQKNTFNNALLHIICAAGAGSAIYFCGRKRLLKAAPYLMILELILLLICPFFGHTINGATRWLSVGSFRFAPALLAMPVLCLFWAYIKDKSENGISKKNGFFLAAVTLLTTGLVFIEPFYSMAALPDSGNF